MNFKRCKKSHATGPATLTGLCFVLAWMLTGCGAPPKDPTADWSPEKLYAEARDEQEAGNFDKAAKMYESLEGRGAGTLLAQQAQLERSYLLYRSGEKAQALATVERFIKLHPTSPAVDYAMYLQGLINFNDNLGFLGNLSRQNLSERDQQASRDAYQAFKLLVEQYPQSKYSVEARDRMAYIVNSLAEYEVHVARYYFRRGAYVAAANRAQQTIQEFQYSPSTEEALSILVRSYDRLGLEQLRDDAERVMRKNYPNSELLSGEGLRSTTRPWWQMW